MLLLSKTQVKEINLIYRALLKNAIMQFAHKSRARQMLAMPSLKDCLKVLKQYLLFPSLVHTKTGGDFNMNKRKPNVESMGIHAK
jgi:hypothetical protein